MPSSWLIHLVPERDADLPNGLGTKLHGLVFELLHRASPALAEATHAERRRPFTVSTLLKAETLRPARRLEVGVTHAVRLTMLRRELEDAIIGHWLSGPSAPLRLGEVEVVQTAALGRDEHPLCGRQTYEELAATPVHKGVRLTFLTPMALRQAGNNLPLPEPQSLFLGFAARWAEFSTTKLPLDVEQVADALENGAVRLARHRLETAVHALSGAPQIGCVGTAEFEFRGDDGVLRTLSALARFAFFAGSGYKTAMGMGQTQVELR